jgi:hypothetical protein
MDFVAFLNFVASNINNEKDQIKVEYFRFV